MPEMSDAPLTRADRAVVAALFAATVAALVAAPASAAAQSMRSTRESADLLLTPGGRAVASVSAGAQVQAHESRGTFTRVTIRGFVDASFLAGARDSFPVSIRGRNGTVRMRASGARTAPIVADLYAGMGLAQASRNGAWAEVSRSGWIRTAALGDPPRGGARSVSAVETSREQPLAERPSPVPESTAEQLGDPATVPEGWVLTPNRATEIRGAPNGTALATAKPGAAIMPLARERGWVRVRVEGWVQERDLVPADSASRRAPSAADLRADPEGHRGQTVSWQVEILKLQFADPLRPGMAPDEPYLLARGPGSEGAVIYLAVPPSLLATARSLPPLTRVSVTARVRNGRSEPVGVPILDLIRIVRM